MSIRLTEHDEGAVRVLTVAGEVDIASAPELSTRLNTAVRCTRGAVVVDLRSVALIDSTGISVLLNALRRMTRSRRRLALVCRPGAVLRVLRTTRLDSTFIVRDSVEDAVMAVSPGVPQAAPA